jgi:CubicO group peptidase (beta-lactamase class C family)
MRRSGTKRLIPVLAAFACLAFAVACGPKAAGPMAPEARAARVENGLLPGILIAGRPVETASISERLAALKTPGVSVAVINDDRVEWARGYGVVEAGSDVPVTPRTLFQAASISKPVAAMAALRLVEKGLLDLDEDVNARLTSWKVPENDLTKTEKVTLRRLLSHTAGLTVHGFGGYAAEAAVPTVVQVLDGQAPANSAAVRVDIIPGKFMRYSGGGFTVMQLLLSDVTGQPFPDLVAELVLGPVGMNDSTYEQPLPAGRRGEAATGHRGDGGLLPGRYHTYPEMAAAGLWTTPADLARFLLEVRKARQGRSSVLTAETAARMTTVEKSNYGLGLSVQGTGPSASFGHGGSNEGFKCQMVAFFEKGQGAVVMTNGDQGSRLAAEIFRSISREYGWPAFKPLEKTVVDVPADALSALTGRYELRPGRTILVTVEDGTLLVIDGEERIELYPESETRFFDLIEGRSIDFRKGPDGKASAMVIDGRLKAPRVGDN